jgi:hypothetical protein
MSADKPSITLTLKSLIQAVAETKEQLKHKLARSSEVYETKITK